MFTTAYWRRVRIAARPHSRHGTSSVQCVTCSPTGRKLSTHVLPSWAKWIVSWANTAESSWTTPSLTGKKKLKLLVLGFRPLRRCSTCSRMTVPAVSSGGLTWPLRVLAVNHRLARRRTLDRTRHEDS